jgi:hypothetical protein
LPLSQIQLADFYKNGRFKFEAEYGHIDNGSLFGASFAFMF